MHCRCRLLGLQATWHPPLSRTPKLLVQYLSCLALPCTIPLACSTFHVQGCACTHAHRRVSIRRRTSASRHELGDACVVEHTRLCRVRCMSWARGDAPPVYAFSPWRFSPASARNPRGAHPRAYARTQSRRAGDTSSGSCKGNGRLRQRDVDVGMEGSPCSLYHWCEQGQ